MHHNASPLWQGDIPALQMIESVPGVAPERRKKLMHVLDIDPAWRMHRVSDGQRRRVQICLGLLKPPEVWGLAWAVTAAWAACSRSPVGDPLAGVSRGCMH